MKVAKLINGNLNFMNLETVVTDRNDLAVTDKGQATPFGFRSHPAGVKFLTDLGFNLVSAANNHAYDFGVAGARDTVRNLATLAAEGRLHFSGIGLNREEASRPVELSLPAGHVAFSAIGIVTNNINAHRATADKPGTMAYRIDEDWREVRRRLTATKADYRILSIHYGEEKDVRADGRQLTEYRDAADHDGVDLIVGHHAHVVRGVEVRHGVPIFYGLGNFMLRGARDMGAEPAFAGCRDYGLLARVHLRRLAPGGRLALRAIEIVPIRDMHRQPAAFADPDQARHRVQVVNVLSARLDDATAPIGDKTRQRAVRLPRRRLGPLLRRRRRERSRRRRPAVPRLERAAATGGSRAGGDHARLHAPPPRGREGEVRQGRQGQGERQGQGRPRARGSALIRQGGGIAGSGARASCWISGTVSARL